MANCAIIGIEYVNRVSPGGWQNALPASLPLIVIAQWCLYLAYSGASHWLIAWAMFVIGSSVVRVVAVHTLAGHEVSSWPYVLLGITGMLLSALAMKEGLR
jgi:hypothetical protein